MRNSLFYQALLLGAVALCAACSGSEDLSIKESPSASQTDVWTAVMNATKDSVHVETRGLFYGGNDGKRYYTLWDEGDVAEVYNSAGTNVGSLSPNSYGHTDSQLTGSLSGTYGVGNPLYVYFPSRALDYTGQDGTIGNLSLKFANMSASTAVKTVDAENHYLDMENASFTANQAYMKIRLTDGDGPRIHPSRLEITSASGKNVKTRAADGTTVYFTDVDPLTITTAIENGEYPDELFVAVRNEQATADEWHFKAYVGEDIFVGPSDRALNWKFDDGVLSIVVRQMRKTTAASTLTITDIPEKTFTGYAITPTLTVKDGETTLTLDADYSVAYTDNVNAGTATATITGLAESGATCTTPYLGTQDKTFSIVQATPVIVMDATTMELVNNGTQNTATRTVTRVFIDNNGNGTWDEGTDYDITGLCTVTYSTDNDAVATVNETSGLVTAAGFGTTTITATVVGATNWTSQTATYTVNVEQEVNGQNTVNPWTSGGEPEGGKIYVE